MRSVIVLCLLALATINVNAKQGFGPGEQDWGFVDVRSDAQMFWWLYYTSANVHQFEEKPLVIWLQGGPGASGTAYGNFMELGPLDINLQPRNLTWVQHYNVLFIDNPVGTGFSHVKNRRALSKNNTQIAHDLVACMKGFYDKLPQFTKTPLYIAGESFGGKMIVEFAMELHKAISDGTIESNLKGTLLIDSWISPIDAVLSYADFLLSSSLVDYNGYKIVKELGVKVDELMKSGQTKLASYLWNQQLATVVGLVGNVDVYNFLTKLPPHPSYKLIPEQDELNNLMNGAVKKTLNLPSSAYWADVPVNGVYDALRTELMKPVTHFVEEILNTTSIKVYVVTGQLDLVVNTPGTLNWVERLQYAYKEQWEQNERKPIIINNFIEGYVKKYGNFAFYWVDRAGHMVPKENPSAMEEILRQLME